jgi:F-type H+-transporting ATPase subunit delta
LARPWGENTYEHREMPAAIANRYASALADVITKPGAEVAATDGLEQLRSFSRMLDQSSQLRIVLLSPAVKPAKKRSLIRSLAARLGMSRPLLNFLMVVADHRRIGMLGEMTDALAALLDDRAGVARIKVSTARPADEAQRQALVAKFSRVTGLLVSAEFDVNEELVGGAAVRHRSTIFDGSLRAQLRAMDRRIRGEV